MMATLASAGPAPMTAIPATPRRRRVRRRRPGRTRGTDQTTPKTIVVRRGPSAPWRRRSWRRGRSRCGRMGTTPSGSASQDQDHGGERRMPRTGDACQLIAGVGLGYDPGPAQDLHEPGCAERVAVLVHQLMLFHLRGVQAEEPGTLRGLRPSGLGGCPVRRGSGGSASAQPAATPSAGTAAPRAPRPAGPPAPPASWRPPAHFLSLLDAFDRRGRHLVYDAHPIQDRDQLGSPPVQICIEVPDPLRAKGPETGGELPLHVAAEVGLLHRRGLPLRQARRLFRHHLADMHALQQSQVRLRAVIPDILRPDQHPLIPVRQQHARQARLDRYAREPIRQR